MSRSSRTEPSRSAIRMVAVFEATKGLLVLLAGFGVLELIHKDLHQAAEQFVRHLHINPARHYPRIFTDAVNHLTDTRLWILALSALLYSLVRFVEAIGLWKQRPWAELFGLLTGGMYIPLEVFEITREVTWPKAAVLIINSLIVIFLAHTLYRSGQRQGMRNK